MVRDIQTSLHVQEIEGIGLGLLEECGGYCICDGRATDHLSFMKRSAGVFVKLAS